MPLAVYEGDIKIYNQFIKKSGKSPLNISNYYSKNSPRTIADLVLFQKALDAGGMNSKIKLVQGANNLRNKKNIEAGLAVAFAQDTWESVAKEDFYIAGPIIRKEDFVKLFYVKKSTASKYKINSLDGLRTLKGITVEGWHKDREVLDKLGLNYITAPNWKLMWSMLERGRADYLFLEPCCDYERQTRHGVTVIPIKGIKASFMEPRSFLVYKRHPMAKQVYDALKKGLNILRENGEIEKALTQACVIIPELESWKDLSQK